MNYKGFRKWKISFLAFKEVSTKHSNKSIKRIAFIVKTFQMHLLKFSTPDDVIQVNDVNRQVANKPFEFNRF